MSNLTMADIRYANRSKGFHFFDRATMRFFDSRVVSAPYHGTGGCFFITSEQFHGSGGYSAPRKSPMNSILPPHASQSALGSPFE